MKLKYKIFVFLTFSLFATSCDKGDVFTGSPVDSSAENITLTGTISTTEQFVVAGEDLPITVTIPQTFDVDVNVQATAFLPSINKKTTKTVTILAGQTSADSTIKLSGGDSSDLPFDLTLQLSLTAITTTPKPDVPAGFAGKQYTMTSNVVELNYGDSLLGGVNAKRCAIRFDFPNFINVTNPLPPSYNNLNIRLKKDGVVTTVSSNATQPINGTTTSNVRGEAINFLDTAADATYTIEVFATKLTSSPIDMPYRFTVRFPDGSVKVIRDVIPALTIGTASTAIPKLQVVRSTVGGVTQYVVTSL